MKTVFFRLLESQSKSAELSRLAKGPSELASHLFVRDIEQFGAIPRTPFAYWVDQTILSLFRLPPLQGNKRSAVSGGKTLDDFRFIRANWEVTRKSDRWVGFAKGGAVSPFYSDIHLNLDWANDARALKAYLVDYRESRGWSPNWTAELHGSQFYFRPGLTWPRRTSSRLALRVMPPGCIFADKGPAAFVEGNASQELLALSAVANSTPFAALVALQLAAADAAARSYEVGVLQRTPLPDCDPESASRLATLAHASWSLKRSTDTITQNSHAFALPAVLQTAGTCLTGRASKWHAQRQAVESDLAQLQQQIDDVCFELYAISAKDRKQIETGFDTSETDSGRASNSAGGDDEVDVLGFAKSLLEWSIGVALGRFEIRLATAERERPTEPKPFDQLPVCSPGMLQDNEGMPAAEAPDGYPIAIPANGILVDDPGHPDDLRTCMELVFDNLGAKHPKSLWEEAQEQLGRGGLERWLRKNCFGEHLARYSKSRRQAPIFWQLGTPSGQYSVWLYYHRTSKDTLYFVLNDYVKPKLSHEQARLTTLTQEAGPTPSTAQRRAIEKQEAFVAELRALKDDVERVAPLWNPDLNDGVIINAAPLWRLFGHTSKWQKATYKCWEKLFAGDYDWAHLAMHLWPERVVPKCADDRSLAIAHDLEDVFWQEDADGKWHKRTVDAGQVKQLIAERASDAVRTARDALIALPGTAGRTKRGARRRKSR